MALARSLTQAGAGDHVFRSPRIAYALLIVVLASCGAAADAPTSSGSRGLNAATAETAPVIAKRFAVAAETITDPGAAMLAAVERRSLQLLNNERAAVGAPPLAVAADLTGSARAWADDMRRNGFRHTPKPSMQHLLGDDRARVGENIAFWSSPSGNHREAALRLQDLWRNSPSHYENQLDRGWTVVGIGIMRDAAGWWAVHQFA